MCGPWGAVCGAAASSASADLTDVEHVWLRPLVNFAS